MILNKIEDSRSRLQKARRWELQQFARANGMSDIAVTDEVLQYAREKGLTELSQFAGKRVGIDNPVVGADVLRLALTMRGLTQISVPPRPLGQMNQPHPRPMYQNGLAVAQPHARARPEQPNIVEADAIDDLSRQYRATKPPARKRLVERPRSEINKLRDACKVLGIHMERRDRKEDLKRKLAEHGTDAAASSQRDS